MSQPLTIWCNYKVTGDVADALAEGVKPHRLVMASSIQESNLVASAPDETLAQADVAFGQPDPATIIGMKNLKWVHLNTAGYERYDRADLREAFQARRATLTNSSSVYDEPCAEHVLAFMLAQARHLPVSLKNQWTDRAWPSWPIRQDMRLLVGQTALLLGFGAIARRLVELLAPLRMNLIAVRRSPTGHEPIPTYSVSELEKLVPSADHILNVLPGGNQTEKLFDANCFKVIRPGAIFYNIGRGSTVDQDALLSALKTGRLEAAYLDVMTPEPLPPDHPLWMQPNCYITPHTSGGHDNERQRLIDHFLANLRRYESKQVLMDKVFA